MGFNFKIVLHIAVRMILLQVLIYETEKKYLLVCSSIVYFRVAEATSNNHCIQDFPKQFSHAP